MTYRVAGIGEVLWDRFPDEDRLGGAPANFAFHASQLGVRASVVSRLGRDADGDRLSALLETRGLSTEFLQRDSIHSTGIVRVRLEEGQPAYVIESPAAWDFLELTSDLKALASTLDAVCFGTLAQRHPATCQTIQEFIQLCPKKALRIFDINLRQDFFTPAIVEFGLSNANVLKLNGNELVQLAHLFGWPAQTEKLTNLLFEKFGLELIALTHGAAGCEIVTRERTIRSSAPAVTCADAVGAGDAFSAALVTGLLSQDPLEKIADHSNRVGAFVASQSGAMPALPEACKIR